MDDMVEDHDTPDTNEVFIKLDAVGNIVPCAGQVLDYHFHGKEFTNISVWDFVAQVDKVWDSRRSKPSNDEESESIDMEMADKTNTCTDTESVSGEDNSVPSARGILTLIAHTQL
jgi:hypothetical protein